MVGMGNGQKEILSRLLTGILAAFGTVVVFWFTFASDVMSRDEVLEAIQDTAPYVEDRKLLAQGVTANAVEVKAINDRLRKIENEQVRLSTKIDVLLMGLIDGRAETQ